MQCQATCMQAPVDGDARGWTFALRGPLFTGTQLLRALP